MAATGQAIHANGITFNCRIDGREGAPWLVFSNSLATDLTLWDGQAALLGDRFRILRYDTRGHGRTEATAPPYSFDLLTADAVALMDAVGIDRAHWVGLSLGGSTGIAMALNHGDRLLSLAVCDSRSRTDPAFVAAWDDRIAVIDAGGMAAIVEPTIQRWFTPPFLEKGKPVCDRVREMIRNTSRGTRPVRPKRRGPCMRWCRDRHASLSIRPRISRTWKTPPSSMPRWRRIWHGRADCANPLRRQSLTGTVRTI
jgi:pimeloyl-ACP methyl ester carboxylesterase